MTTIQKHLNNFTAKNSFDYFIHKDLGKFLRRELDFYIKNEIMHLDDIESDTAPRVEQYLGKVKVLRKVAGKIIRFLANLEDFQKKLWLKKKFVLETNYCITLDRIPEELYSEIVKNEKQREEWVKLFAIDEITGQGKTLLENKVSYTEPLTVEFLKANPYLVLDTAFFDNDFKYKLLSSIDNIDEQCDGLLIHGENFQALNLLQEKQRGRLKCIYIDPPYNTGNDGFVYKDGYSHSSWLTMMKDRLQLAKEQLPDDGVIFISIDDHEIDNLKKICDTVFGERNFIGIFKWNKVAKAPSLSNLIRNKYEYILCYQTGNAKQLCGKKSYNTQGPVWHNPNKPKELYFREKSIKLKMSFKKGCKSEKYHVELLDDLIEENGLNKFPVRIVASSAWGQEKINQYISNGRTFEFKKNIGTLYADLDSEDNFISPSDIINKTECEVDNNTDATENLKKLGICFGNPKPVSLIRYLLSTVHSEKTVILDFFSGSGTTGHAVINLNREDGGSRKYILVEMGKYFDSVTKPRIEKVVYSDEWKDGKPVSRKGSSHCFKYIRLESYEDALDNLKFSRTEQQDNLLLQENNKSIKEQYMLGYMMDLETKDSLLNIDNFKHPFDYEMKITRDGEVKTVRADLVETFNYLIGLNVKHIQNVRGVLAIEGITRSGEKTLVLWRNTDEITNEDLDNWFKKQEYSTQDMEFDTIYVNGDNNLENLRKPDESWKVCLIEAEFLKRMFDIEDV